MMIIVCCSAVTFQLDAIDVLFTNVIVIYVVATRLICSLLHFYGVTPFCVSLLCLCVVFLF